MSVSHFICCVGNASSTDFTVATQQIELTRSNSPSVQVTLSADAVALEPVETFRLTLEGTVTLQSGWFFIDTVDVTIEDQDGEINLYVHSLTTHLYHHSITCVQSNSKSSK